MTILAWKTTSNLMKKTPKIDQIVLIKDLLKKKNMISYNLVKIQMKTWSMIKKEEVNDNDKTKLEPYQKLVSKLMYLLFETKLDITLVGSQLSWQNSDSKIAYFKAVKEIITYLKVTIHLELVF